MSFVDLCDNTKNNIKAFWLTVVEVEVSNYVWGTTKI